MQPECFFAFDSNSALEQLDLMRKKKQFEQEVRGGQEFKQIYCRDILVIRIIEPWGNGFLFKINCNPVEIGIKKEVESKVWILCLCFPVLIKGKGQALSAGWGLLVSIIHGKYVCTLKCKEWALSSSSADIFGVGSSHLWRNLLQSKVFSAMAEGSELDDLQTQTIP